MLAREGGQLLVDHFRRRLGGDEVGGLIQFIYREYIPISTSA